MELLFMYLITIIVAYGMKMTVALKMIKDVMDCGYKLDYQKILESSEELKSEEFTNIQNANKIALFIPVINILESLKLSAQYIQAKEQMLDVFNSMGVLTELTEEEEREYLENPSIMNSLKITVADAVKKSIKIKKSGTIEINFKDDGSKIVAELDENNNLEIVEVLGPIKDLNLSEEEYKKMALKNLDIIFGKDPEKYTSIENFEESLKNMELTKPDNSSEKSVQPDNSSEKLAQSDNSISKSTAKIRLKIGDKEIINKKIEIPPKKVDETETKTETKIKQRSRKK